MANYDCIVVGAGFAGIFTASYLANSGKKVILIEKNKKSGGLFQTIEIKGNKYYLGAHHISGISKNNFVVHAFQRMNIDIENFLIESETFGILMDGDMYEVPIKIEEMGQYIKSKFPSENRTDEFIEEIKRFQKYFNENDEKGELLMFAKTSNISYKEYLEQYFENEKLRKILCSLGPVYGAVCANDSAFSNLSLLVTYSIGSYYIKNGNEYLLEQMMDRLLNGGGSVEYSTKVIDIIKDDKKIIGVTCKAQSNKQIYNIYGDNIVFASYPFDILESNFCDLRICRRAKSLSAGASVIRIYCTLSEYPQCPTDVIYMGNYEIEEMGKHIYLDNNSAKLPICVIGYSGKILNETKESPKTCMITFLTYERTFSNINLKENIIQMLKKELPEIAKNIKVESIVDFHLYKAITNTDSGSVFGWKRNTDALIVANAFAPMIKGLQGIYLVGNWSANFGLYGAIHSSIKVCDKIVHK